MPDSFGVSRGRTTDRVFPPPILALSASKSPARGPESDPERLAPSVGLSILWGSLFGAAAGVREWSRTGQIGRSRHLRRDPTTFEAPIEARRGSGNGSNAVCPDLSEPSSAGVAVRKDRVIMSTLNAPAPAAKPG